MKIIALFASLQIASAANINTKATSLQQESDGCVKYVAKFLKRPVTKSIATELAMDYCAVNKLVNDENFVCPRFRSIVDAAFRREPTTQTYDAQSFCGITEAYVSDLEGAAKIPHMGEGSGKDFEVSKKCEPTTLNSFGTGVKTLPSGKVADFWFAMCMNQDCAHFLPSRTRWCSKDHQPTHSASVCEAVRLFARGDSSKFSADMDAKEVCKVYDDFVEDTELNVDAYMHVVHAKEHKVPSPKDKKRALDSAAMKHEAGENEIRNNMATPVESVAAAQVPMLLVTLIGLIACRP